MFFCTKCGKQNPDTAKFCTGCGTTLKATVILPTASSATSEVNHSVVSERPLNSKKKWIVPGIIALLGLNAGAYFIFLNKKKQTNTVQENKSSVVDSTKNADSTTYRETNTSNTNSINISFESRKIPHPLVPIVKATDILPQWTENEELNGNHSLIALYVGAIGKKPIKLFITSVDTVNKSLVGYSIVGSNNVNFKGSYTERFKKGVSTPHYHFEDFDAWIYALTLFEPEGININGVFQLELKDTQIGTGICTGTWVSYSGKLYREIRIENPHDFAADR